MRRSECRGRRGRPQEGQRGLRPCSHAPARRLRRSSYPAFCAWTASVARSLQCTRRQQLLQLREIRSTWHHGTKCCGLLARLALSFRCAALGGRARVRAGWRSQRAAAGQRLCRATSRGPNNTTCNSGHAVVTSVLVNLFFFYCMPLCITLLTTGNVCRAGSRQLAIE